MKWITIHHSATSELPTRPTYLAFCLLFGLGALELANPAFSTFLSAILLSKSTLISSEAQIKLLSAQDSLPIYKSTKIKQFGHIFILYILKHEI